MKFHPLTFAALTAIALLVTAESAVVFNHAERVAAGWWGRAQVRAASSGAARFAQVLVRVVVCGTKR